MKNRRKCKIKKLIKRERKNGENKIKAERNRGRVF